MTREEQSSNAHEVVEELAEVVREYASQADYVAQVGNKVDVRGNEITAALKEAFASAIRLEELEVIDFQALSAMELAEALGRYPIILKPLLAVSNIGARAIERDLELKNVDTYGLKLKPQ